jgi:cytidylate kinase
MSLHLHGQGPRSMSALVDHQIMAWRLRNRRDVADLPTPVAMPVVTISRESSALGADVARALSKDLGFRLWDESLVSVVADRVGAGEDILRVLDERERGPIDDAFASQFLGVRVSSEIYRATLSRVLDELGVAGAGVIVGRGANFVLSATRAFRVRIVCPFAQRTARYAANYGKSSEASAQAVRDLDRARVGFVRQFCGRDATDTTAYDLIVNTERLSVEEATHLIAEAYRARFAKRDPASLENGLQAAP